MKRFYVFFRLLKILEVAPTLLGSIAEKHERAFFSGNIENGTGKRRSSQMMLVYLEQIAAGRAVSTPICSTPDAVLDSDTEEV